LENPSHLFDMPGAYDITLTVQTAYGEITGLKQNFIVALADTVTAGTAEGLLNETIEIIINVVNNIALDRMIIPVEYDGPVTLEYLGHSTESCRTALFENITYLDEDSVNNQFTLDIEAGIAEAMEPGTGSVIKLNFMIIDGDDTGDSNTVNLSGYETYTPTFSGEAAEYEPKVVSGRIVYSGCCVGATGNVNCSVDDNPDISDITRLIDYLYLSHAPLCCTEEADVNISGGEPDISDITKLIDFLYLTHEPLPDCP